jgi:EpsI family protein
LEFASFVIVIAASIALLFGRHTLQRHWFPILYLFLMVPIWNSAIDWLQDPSRVVSATIATSVLQTIGIPVMRQGTNIVLPLHTLAVMRECSGVNQLVATIAMVIPVAYLWLSGRIRRLLFVALAVLITYLSNGFRIALVGWLTYNGHGDGDLLGSYTHVSEGLVVAMVGYLAISGCFTVLSRLGRRSTRAASLERSASSVAPRMLTHRRLWLDTAIVVLMLTVGMSRLFAVSADVQLDEALNQFPAAIGDWTVSDAGLSEPLIGVPVELVDAYPGPAHELRFTAVDDELVRTYRNPAGIQLQLYVGFYRRQEEGKELTGPAAEQLRLVASHVDLRPSVDVAVGEVVREKSGVAQGMLFWYDINGRISPRLYTAKAYSIWDALTRRRTDAAVIMIGWQGVAASSSAEVRRCARDLAARLIPVLRHHLPA